MAKWLESSTGNLFGYTSLGTSLILNTSRKWLTHTITPRAPQPKWLLSAPGVCSRFAVCVC